MRDPETIAAQAERLSELEREATVLLEACATGSARFSRADGGD